MGEIGVLEYRQALVVVHRQHRVEALQLVWQERGIGWQRANQTQPFAAQVVQGGNDDVQFFPAQMTVFASVRIQTQYGDGGHSKSKLGAQCRIYDTQGAHHGRGGDRISDFAQWKMHGLQSHSQV